MREKVSLSKRWLTRHATKVVLLVAAMMFIIPLGITKYQQNDIEKAQKSIQELAQKNSKTIAEIQRERQERITTQKAINAYFCAQNNEQDGLLAGLLAFSLIASPPDSDLTEQQLMGKEIFEAALADLESQTDCGALRFGEIKPKSKPNTLKPKDP